MGNIILKFENLNPERYNIPEFEPLVFDLFNTPTQVNRVINNTNKKYYVILFTDEFYINIDPNANYNLKLSEDDRDEKIFYWSKFKNIYPWNREKNYSWFKIQ